MKDDLISRAAAIDDLHGKDPSQVWDTADIEVWVNALPSAQPTDTDIQKMQDIEQAMLEKAYECGKQDAAQWISCSERLPDEDYWTGANFQYSADVLMTVYNAEDEETIIDYGHTVDGSWYSDTTDCLVPSWWEVLAWMPLPEPYREVSEK